MERRLQPTSDGHKMNLLKPRRRASGGDVEFAQLVKVDGRTPEGTHRYSPP